jgi:hypothetical protein
LQIDNAATLNELNELRKQQQVLEQSLAESRQKLEQAQREQVVVLESEPQPDATTVAAAPVASAATASGYRRYGWYHWVTPCGTQLQ